MTTQRHQSTPRQWKSGGTAMLIAAWGACFVGLSGADAFFRSTPDYSSGYVTAYSQNGNGSVTAEVRPAARGGYEYRIPGRAWWPCEGDCELTITNKVLDFWDNQATKAYPGRGITFGVPY